MSRLTRWTRRNRNFVLVTGYIFVEVAAFLWAAERMGLL